MHIVIKEQKVRANEIDNFQILNIYINFHFYLQFKESNLTTVCYQ